VEAGLVTALDVVGRHVDTGEQTVHRTRNVVVAPGLTPRLPAGVSGSARVWHSSELLNRVAADVPPDPKRFVVVGAGQSAAETADHLYRTFESAEICAVHSRYGYSTVDGSPFVNQIFDPAAVDDFFGAPGEVREMLLDYHSNTNYSVVDLDLVQELYRRVYLEDAVGRRRLRILRASRVRDVDETGAGVRVAVEFLPTGAVETIEADAVIFATGYHPVDPMPLLGELASECKRDTLGRPVLQRDYRLVMSDRVRCGIYLQGGSEHSHGISSSLLSNVAVRAGEIAQSIRSS
jgi:L-ornithine N5-monooxygenase